MEERDLHALWETLVATDGSPSGGTGATYSTLGGPGAAHRIDIDDLPSFAISESGEARETTAFDPEQVRQTIGSGSPRPPSDEGAPGESPPTQGSDPAPAPAGAPERIARYQITTRVGRGGMGEVFEAEQLSLQRSVALKRALKGAEGSALRAKFVSEAVVTAFLDHPNIVPVYDLGRDASGQVAMTMKIVRGVSWKSLLHPKTDEEKARAEAYDQEKHLEVLLAVSNAIAYANSRGIVHCDLKPENVMIGEFGEVLVMDWGLAVDYTGADRGLPLPAAKSVQDPMGTPCYLSPELAQGNGSLIGPPTDVYLLGGILYEIVSGRPPNAGKTLREVVHSAVFERPERLDDGMPAEIRAICEKALAKDPRERYQSVLEMRRALEDLVDHRESLLITEAAQKTLQQCRQAIARPRGVSQNQLYFRFASAIAGFEQALGLWSGNDAARDGMRTARLELAQRALSQGDLGLASALIETLGRDQEDTRALGEQLDAAMVANERARRGARFLKVVLVATAAAAILGLTLGLLMVQEEQRRTALSYASLYTQSLGVFRSEYTAKIVNRLQPLGVTTSHDYIHDNEIPFPATFSIELAEAISRESQGVRARLFSSYPFPWRTDGGPRSEFERAALAASEEHPRDPYYRFDVVDGQPRLHYARPVLLGESCVGCHNSHPDSPRTTWKVGDVRGVQTVDIPVGRASTQFGELLLIAAANPWFLGALVLVLAAAVAALRRKRVTG